MRELFVRVRITYFIPFFFFYTGSVLGTRLRERTGKPETFNKVKLELHVRSLTIDFYYTSAAIYTSESTLLERLNICGRNSRFIINSKIYNPHTINTGN